MSEEAPEGSLERRWARRCLLRSAEDARARGKSFREWEESEDQSFLDAVSQQDMDAIFNLVWQGKLLGVRKK